MDFARPTEFLAIARERRKIMMRSRCEIRRPVAERAFDPETGTYPDPGHTVIYAGICSIRPKSTASPAKRESNIGEAEVVFETYEIDVPLDCPPVRTSDTALITESDDQWVVGVALPVGWVEYADNRTHRSMIVFSQDRTAVNDG